MGRDPRPHLAGSCSCAWPAERDRHDQAVGIGTGGHQRVTASGKSRVASTRSRDRLEARIPSSTGATAPGQRLPGPTRRSPPRRWQSSPGANRRFDRLGEEGGVLLLEGCVRGDSTINELSRRRRSRPRRTASRLDDLPSSTEKSAAERAQRDAALRWLALRTPYRAPPRSSRDGSCSAVPAPAWTPEFEDEPARNAPGGRQR